MPAVLNLVWDKLLPAMKPGALPADKVAQERLRKRLAGLTVRPASGNASSPLAAALSGRKYFFPANNRSIESAALEFSTDSAALVVRTSLGENRIACGAGAWLRGRTAFLDGLEGRMVVPGEHPVAASGAWTSDDTYTVKLCLYETPFYVTLAFRFQGDELQFNSEFNAAFGPTTLPQLVGRAK
jgi:hypothetical protein